VSSQIASKDKEHLSSQNNPASGKTNKDVIRSELESKTTKGEAKDGSKT
jgi:hypothetical protein